MIAREQLEMLLLDRSLGGCTPEVSALLDAYLEKDAEARLEAERWGSLVGRARAAMGAERAVLPPFPLERLLRRERRQRVWRMGAVISGVAACVVAGVLVGAAWDADGKGTSAVAKEPESKPVGTEPARGMADAGEAGGVENFWSVARIEHDARQNRGGAVPVRPAGWERFNSGNPFGGVR